jgi:hypothetical protein
MSRCGNLLTCVTILQNPICANVPQPSSNSLKGFQLRRLSLKVYLAGATMKPSPLGFIVSKNRGLTAYTSVAGAVASLLCPPHLIATEAAEQLLDYRDLGRRKR